MLSRHRVSRVAIELIERFEGHRRHAAQLPDGRWTIGYGHTLTAREGAEVCQTDAEALLVYDLIAVQHAINEQTFAPLSQNQFDALCSFAFNVGLDNFRRSQVLKRLNAGAAVQAACAMELWRKAEFEGERIVVDALVRRRAAEKALFLTPDDGVWVAAPSPLLRPLIDLDALDLVPMRRPVEVRASMEGDRVTARREAFPDDEPRPERVPDPVPAVTAAAEAVAGRLESLFADPGVEPEAAPEPTPAEIEPEAFAPNVDLRPPEDWPRDWPDPEPDPVAEVEPEAEPQPVQAAPEPAAVEPATQADAGLEIPQAPMRERQDDPPAPHVEVEIAPSEFIPARNRPPPARREASVAWDLALALFGLAFFGFGIFWGLNARSAPAGGVLTPMIVAWLAGLAGIGFVVVAVFHLLQRLGRAAEQD
ncbi:glycoside hydrolase family protein [Phenylobacterium sp.]|uniref:glycoside hydrolase family protein n=1 Tax=Phenylobacterium sp. TaxID=1871053 RepID=UPI0025EA62E0|nr:glycoside hydrolase family protein [Phenylobacterium sp.]